MNTSFLAALSSVLLAFTVSACAATPQALPPAPLGGSPADGPAPVCNVQSLAWTIGQMADEALIKRARAESGAKSVRVLRPGMMVTQEFDATRLNIRVDNSHKVLSYRCG